MASEISGDSGYLAIRPEATEGVVVGAGNIFVPFYEESLTTESNPETENSVFGSKFARLQATPGVRSHGGDITVMAEPNSTAHFLNALLTVGSITGSGPYTWPFTASFTKPKSYTYDVSDGFKVSRFAGVQISELSGDVKDNEFRWKLKTAALKSFLGAEIASASTSTLTLATPTAYPTPTDCLVVGDAVAVVNQSTNAKQTFTISSLTSTTVTLSGTPTGVTAGDTLVLNPQTVDLSKILMTPFLWSRMQWCFGTTATAALSATHTPVEDGSEFTIQHPFEDEKGAQSSGSFDPSALVRAKSVDATVKAKLYFRGPDQVKNFVGFKKVALVIRMYAGASYECRITLNNLTVTSGGAKPMIKTDEAEFYELEYTPTYDLTDGQGMDIKVINSAAS